MFIPLALACEMLSASLQLPREGNAERCTPAVPAETHLPQTEVEGRGEPAAALVLWAPRPRIDPTDVNRNRLSPLVWMKGKLRDLLN